MIGVDCANCSKRAHIDSVDLIVLAYYPSFDDDRESFMQYNCPMCNVISCRPINLDEQILLTRGGYTFTAIPYESGADVLTIDYAIELARELDSL